MSGPVLFYRSQVEPGRPRPDFGSGTSRLIFEVAPEIKEDAVLRHRWFFNRRDGFVRRHRILNRLKNPVGRFPPIDEVV